MARYYRKLSFTPLAKFTGIFDGCVILKRQKNPVTAVPACSPENTLAHFEGRLGKETDCWDVHSTEELSDRGFILLDVRSPTLFARGHLPGAINLPHPKIDAAALQEYAADTLFVVYCAGPHCNGACRAAIQIAKLGRPVKEMIGGVTGWLDEGFTLVTVD